MTTVVLGLDGAAFELIDRWIADGTLPTFARLTEEGAATDMQSCPPPTTCPNWQCYATGTNPGELGVFWWEHVDAATQSITATSDSSQFDGHFYWNYLDEEYAVINLPTSYPPPDEPNGVHIAGGPGAEQSGYTAPPELEDYLQHEYDYSVHPDNIGDLDATRPHSPCVPEIYDLIDRRFDVLEEYVADDDIGFVHCTIFYINVLQHFYWNHEVVRRAWERIDDRLENLLALDDIETLYVMSDHGSNEIETTFLINVWLEREGYLHTTTGLSDILHWVGLTRERIRPLVASLGIEWWLRHLLPRRIQTLVPDSEGSVTEGAKAGVVNWKKSTALASGQGPLYILSQKADERKRISNELREKLDGLHHDGRSIIDAVDPSEDIYHGPHLDRAPDLILRQAPGVHIDGAIGAGSREPFEDPEHWHGENKETGLFIAHGTEIDPDSDLADMHILDIAPTVLHQQEIAVPTNLDGEVRRNLFAEGSDPAAREPRTRIPEKMTGGAASEVESEVSERLSDLGYIR